jgi:SOS-response transcriptional repressor LexA
MIQEKAKPSDVVSGNVSPAREENLIRLARLLAYQKLKGWDDSDLGRQCERTPQQVYAWTHNRNIGEKLARRIEEKLGLPRFYLDERENVPIGSSPGEPSSHLRGHPLSGGGLGPSAHVENAGRSLPVLPWTLLGTMLNLDNSEIEDTSPLLETFAPTSARAKFVEMNDDSMAPNFMPGDHILFDPMEAPRAGDTVLVRLPSHEHFVRTFRPRTAYVFEAVAVNPDYQPISSVDDGAMVIAVMVEHRRYRRRG